jgi:hypothetical protein
MMSNAQTHATTFGFTVRMVRPAGAAVIRDSAYQAAAHRVRSFRRRAHCSRPL